LLSRVKVAGKKCKRFVLIVKAVRILLKFNIIPLTSY
jgi:hypothetical protein